MKDCPYLGIGAGVLWYPRVRYCFDPNNDLFSLEWKTMTYLLGKFFQTIPMDGTFHQRRPLCRLSGAKSYPCLSFLPFRGTLKALQPSELVDSGLVSPSRSLIDIFSLIRRTTLGPSSVSYPSLRIPEPVPKLQLVFSFRDETLPDSTESKSDFPPEASDSTLTHPESTIDPSPLPVFLSSLPEPDPLLLKPKDQADPGRLRADRCLPGEIGAPEALYSVGTRFENLISPFTNQQSALIPWCGVKAKGEFLSCLAQKLSLFSLEKDSPAARREQTAIGCFAYLFYYGRLGDIRGRPSFLSGYDHSFIHSFNLGDNH
ncbi:hypothetical protein K1719_047242 [Acacia pycnantha]|nr:hypothetical protein K1719_047242 [Acacia pycnantha]